ncbi:MAG TPA: toprim domain-containing protein, partial [Candidatus Baltobacteraceae bacterium]|nr:toprim domain-containing protein [Candidatus Baltobacteraceae bacterium]
KSLIIAIGTNIGEAFKIEDLRYNRIILMTDADVDGAHIRTLLLTLFYRYLPDLITKGHLYIAQPPLYQLRRGKEIHYAYDEAAKEKILKEMLEAKAAKAAAKGKKKEEEEEAVAEEGGEPSAEASEGEPGEVTAVGGVIIQRYKGLGEMNPDQLWETTMNPESRVMLQVTVDDADKANQMFDILMGSEVEPRKNFIQTHAKKVKNLDV